MQNTSPQFPSRSEEPHASLHCATSGPAGGHGKSRSRRSGEEGVRLPMTEKQNIRKQILTIRNATPRKDIAAMSAIICAKIAASPEYRSCTSLMTYLSTGSEVVLDDLICRAWEEGKRVVAPVCRPQERRLVILPITCFADVEPGYCGIREPKPSLLAPVAADEIDVVLVPAVAYDRRGYRVGYGGGYYDRFFAGMKRHAVKIGIAFSCQLVPVIPADPHDIPVDLIVTEEEIIDTGTRPPLP
jgi:5-formyltetrahydrofolate cyclo-ligase